MQAKKETAKKKITKEMVQEVWLKKLKSEYPHMSREERLKYLFEILRF